MGKIDPKLQTVVFLCFSESFHGNTCNLNVIVEFMARIYKRGPIPTICNTFLFKIPKLDFLPMHEAKIRSRGYQTFFMLKSAELEISIPHKY